MTQTIPPKLIAFYLPQFHPIPENDEWWGKGFTEWTNVTKAKPLFHGHYQPHLPTDMGFYDLRLRQTRRDQIDLAKSYGIDGFCYHYYWFSGKRLLEQPIDDMLADPESDMPFCLCWANENWTRRWDAKEREVLIEQRYAPEDDEDFIKSLVPYITDKRYIRFNGAPLILVYRPSHLPDARRSIEIWREYCQRNGIGDIHVACALTHGNWDYKTMGFDSGVEFPPHNLDVPNIADQLFFYDEFKGYCVDFADVGEFYLNFDHDEPFASVFKAVYPSWDNTARRRDLALVTLNGTPENYATWLGRTIEKVKQDYPGEERLVFINAWNEWAEGCHLEPDRKHDHAFLAATHDAKEGNFPKDWTHRGVPKECLSPPQRISYKTVKARSMQKSAVKRAFRAVRDTLNGRRFSEKYKKKNAEALKLEPAVFIHIQKTAGSSIVSVAREMYGDFDTSSYADFQDPRIHKKKFVSGHFGFNYAEDLCANRFSFTFLRDPVERLISFYNFCRHQDPAKQPTYALAHDLSFPDFIDRLSQKTDDETEIHLLEHAWNHMTWQLAWGWGGAASERKTALDFEPDELLAMAKKNLQRLSFVGFAETFDEDARHVFKSLGIEEVDIPYSNVSEKVVVLDDLDAETQAKLAALTKLDAELYEFAQSLRRAGGGQVETTKPETAGTVG